jgi:hypothetical protein
MNLLRRTAIAHAVLFVLLAVLALVDDTQVTGLNRWVKPTKFAASIAIYLGSMAYFWPVAVASGRAKDRAAQVLAGTLIFEMLIIAGQAARGVRSHFNVSTPLDGALFQIMGLAIVANIVTAAVVCRWTFRAAPSAYVWGVRLGLALFVIFAFEGFLMVQRLAHSVGVPDGGPGLPFVNWSTEGGDLRVAHFVGMHALQALPAAGWLTGRAGAVFTLAAVWAALATALLARALMGLPL